MTKRITCKCFVCPRVCGPTAISFRGYMVHDINCWFFLSRAYFRTVYF